MSSETLKTSKFEKPLALFPEKSRILYEKTYEEFKAWCEFYGCEEKNLTYYSESVLLEYFSSLVKRGLVGSLLPKFSMLKANLNQKEAVDIGKYNKLAYYIKTQTEDYKPKKSRIFTKDEITKFIANAPNRTFLMLKVVLIFGIAGALRKEELLKLEMNDVQDLVSKFIVTVKPSKTKTKKVFTIVDNEEKSLLNLIRHYIALRPAHTPHRRFFIYYKNCKCTTQPVGLNSFSKLPSQIARFLGLDQPHLYTGHCFRRSSDSISTEARQWKSQTYTLGGAEIINSKEVKH